MVITTMRVVRTAATVTAAESESELSSWNMFHGVFDRYGWWKSFTVGLAGVEDPDSVQHLYGTRDDITGAHYPFLNNLWREKSQQMTRPVHRLPKLSVMTASEYECRKNLCLRTVLPYIHCGSNEHMVPRNSVQDV